MKIDNNIKNELFNKYRIEPFQTEDVDLNEIDELISNDELKAIFGLNLMEMIEAIKQKDVDKEAMKKLLIADINFYKLAKKRNITLYGTSFLMKVANTINYDVDKLYEVLNTGAYNNKFGQR